MPLHRSSRSEYLPLRSSLPILDELERRIAAIDAPTWCVVLAACLCVDRNVASCNSVYEDLLGAGWVQNGRILEGDVVSDCISIEAYMTSMHTHYARSNLPCALAG